MVRLDGTMCQIDWTLVIGGLTAIGTIAIACLAIWGNWVKFRLTPPKLRIEPHNLRGTLTRFTNGPRVIYYHLKATNSRPWSVARNCRVILRAIYRRLPNGEFQNVPLPVLPSFVWAPAEVTPPVIDLSHEQTLDFGRIVEGGNHFEPILYFFPNNFEGFVTPHNAIRYALEIVAEGFKSERFQVFEVAWDGAWSDNLDTMGNHLTVREITIESAS